VDEIFARGWDQLLDRLDGPLSFRFLMQPAVAATLALLAGIRDARTGRPPFLWTMVTEPSERRTLLSSAWHDVQMVFVVAVLLDGVYQLVVIRFFYPVQALIVAGLLAFVPYVVLRGLVTRLILHSIGGSRYR
jgi:hypothetical protein